MPINSISGAFSTAEQVRHTESAAAKGAFMGNAVVQQPSPESLLADAAEELTFSADTTDDFELEERKERDKIKKSEEERVKLYQELMHEAGKSEQLNQLRDSLHTRADSRRALDKAREYFPDPSDAWAALRQMQEELRSGEADEALLSDVDAAVAELEEREGPAIRAGVQGALASAGFRDLGGSDEMRDFYRRTVCEFGSVNEVFAHVMEKYGGDFDKAMVSRRQSADKGIGSGQAGSLLNFGAGRAGAAIGDVLRYRAAEQVNVLLHDADGPAQAVQRHAAHVLAVNQDLAARHIIETGDQVAQRCLAAAGRPDERDILARADMQINVAQDLVVVVGVLKADVVKVDAAVLHDQRLRVGGIGDGDGRIHDLGKALDAGHAALELLGKFDDTADGRDQRRDIQHIRDKVARADGPVHKGQSARQNDNKVHQTVKKPRGRVECRHGVVA